MSSHDKGEHEDVEEEGGRTMTLMRMMYLFSS